MLTRPALHTSHRAITAVLVLWLCVLAASVWAPVARAHGSQQHAVHLCSGELAPLGTPSPLATDDTGMALHHALDCPLCMPVLAPPPSHHGWRLHELAPQAPRIAVAVVHAAPSTAWPPARGPPLCNNPSLATRRSQHGAGLRQSNYISKKVCMLKNSKWLSVAGLCAALIAGPVLAHPDAAHVQAEGAWARASVPGQQATGAFVRLTAQEPLQLVGVETPVAAVGEIHEMKMEGDVMRMRPIDSLDLPQGHTVELKPGGYHLMFQQLKAPLTEGAEVPVTLVFKDAKGELSRLHLQVPVQRKSPSAGHGHGHGHATPHAHGH